MNAYYKGMPVFGPRGPAGPDGNPIGTVISFMGTAAPEDYLVCDGGTYGVSGYPELADFFRRQFGSVNHFGGDGSATFAVPDLRNLFLRGYHGEAEEVLSGEVGEKQEATVHPSITGVQTNGNKALFAYTSATNSAAGSLPNNEDTFYQPKPRYSLLSSAGNAPMNTSDNPAYKVSYTSRPVNMAVLFCIKAVESALEAAVEDYDTADGWHVRKWPDGYMEQTLNKETQDVTVANSWGTGYSSGRNYGPFEYPEAFSHLYGVNISGTGPYSALITSYYPNYEAEHLTKTPEIGLYRPAPVNTRATFYIYVTAKGRWK